jgi:hypothetical protein
VSPKVKKNQIYITRLKVIGCSFISGTKVVKGWLVRKDPESEDEEIRSECTILKLKTL